MHERIHFLTASWKEKTETIYRAEEAKKKEKAIGETQRSSPGAGDGCL